MLTQALTTLLVAAALGTALLATGYLALRNSVGMVALVLGVWIITVALRDSVDLYAAVDLPVVGPDTRIYALDVLSLVMVVVGVGRTFTHGFRGMGHGLALTLLLLLTVHIARGIPDVGVQTAVVDSRGWFYFAAALLYAATVPGGWERRVWEVLTGAGILLAAIAASYWLVEGLRSSWEGEERAMVAAGGLLILQAAILAPALGWPSRRAAVWVMFGAGAVTLLLAHRTLWVAGLVVGILAFIWWSAGRWRKAKSTVLAVTGVLVLALPLAVWGFARTEPLVQSLEGAVASDSTFTHRATLWQELVSSKSSASQIAAGEPAGNWHELRVVTWSEIERLGEGPISPHNAFVDAYGRFGLPGVLVYCWLFLLLWLHRAGVASATGLTAGAVGLLVITQLLFSITFTLDTAQGLITGILVSGLVAASPVRAAVDAVRGAGRPRTSVPQS